MHTFLSVQYARFRALTVVRQRAVAALLMIAVLMFILAATGSGKNGAAFIEVVRGPISETVSVTGSLKPADDVELSFQNSGRVSRVSAQVGDRVVQGQLIASLDNSELSAQLRDAEASVLAQEARLMNIEGGGRAEEIAIKESELRSAQQALQNAYDNVYDILIDGYDKADSALRVQLYPMFLSAGTEASPVYSLTFSCQCEVQAKMATERRALAEVALTRWRGELEGIALTGTPDALRVAVTNAQSYLKTVRDSVNSAGVLLEDATYNISAGSATIEDYRTRVSTARAAIVAATTAVNTQDQLIATNAVAVERAEAALALTTAGSTPQEIATQRALLLSAQAQADRYRSLISKGIIRSPIRGVVTKQDAKVGQNATANVVLVAVISDQQLELEANVPEVDIGKVSVGDSIKLTVDALPGEIYGAHVTFIDPAETVIDGVVNFKIQAQLDVADDRLKSGLTVNMDIESERKEDVLIVPQVAIIENDDGTFVRFADGSERAVRTGIRSQEGMIEIISGLTEGELIQNIGLKTQ